MILKLFTNSDRNSYGKIEKFSYHLVFHPVCKGQIISKANYAVLNSSKKRTKLTTLSIYFTEDSEFPSFFGRIEETINCFRDLLTFSTQERNTDSPEPSTVFFFNTLDN